MLLILSQWYPPAFKAGGPIRSVYNLTEGLKEFVELTVLTSGRDIDGTNVQHSTGSGVQVIHTNWEMIRRLRKHRGLVYLNTMFSWRYGILPVLVCPETLMSPRGMLRPSALSHKALKKRMFLKIANRLQLYKNTHFIASNEEEAADVRASIRRYASMRVIANAAMQPLPKPIALPKESGTVRLLFVGRIHPIKNLDFLLEVLRSLPVPIQLHIVGNEEYSAYRKSCEELMEACRSAGHDIVAHGARNTEFIHDLLKSVHFLVSPSKGENFGHAIFDALACGRPVLISDQTPWRKLQAKQAGWDLPLSKTLWMEHLRKISAMDQDAFDVLCRGALDLARTYYKESRSVSDFVQMLHELSPDY